MKDETVRLRERRAELVQRLDAIAKDMRQGLDADSEERAIQLENADVLDEIARVAREELQEIDETLARLAVRGQQG